MICRTAAELISRSFDGSLSLRERAGVWVHKLFCGPCRRFQKQCACLHTHCDALLAAEVLRADPPLPEATRARIAAAIANKALE